MKQLLTSFLVIVGLLGSVFAAVALTSSPASAAPTAGTTKYATTVVAFKAVPPDSGSTPSLFLTSRSNSSGLCPSAQPVRFLANNISASRRLRTNYDPTPTNVANNDQVDCTYTVTIQSNLADCTYSYSLDNGATFTTGSSFTLQGGDSPNYATTTGIFSNVSSAGIIVVKPAGCTHPAILHSPTLLNIQNIEPDIRYQLSYTPFGNCSAINTPLTDLQGRQWSQALLDLSCNWRVTFTPVESQNLTGCRVEAIIYFTDGTHKVESDGDLFINSTIDRVNTIITRYPAIDGKRIVRVDLSSSNAPSASGVCQEKIPLVVKVGLVGAANNVAFNNEKVTFEIRPLNDIPARPCTAKTRITGTPAAPATISLVKLPAGAQIACSYRLTAVATSAVLQLAGNQTGTVDFGTSGLARADYLYQYTLRRVPVQVGLQVAAPAGSSFRTNQRIEVHVTVPGDCRNDTTFLGGVTGTVGAQYSMLIVPGVTYAIGPGARSVDARASYTLQPYVFAGGRQVNCTVRATVTSADSQCTPISPLRDAAGRTYVEASWIPGSSQIDVLLQYNCRSFGGQTTDPNDTVSSDDGQIALPRGWVMLPFNGATGTTPRALAAELDNSVASLWVWDSPTQRWRGWRANGASAGLTSLDKGSVFMAYVPTARRVSYIPTTLLDPPAATGRLTLPSGYSVQVFGGDESRRLSSLLGTQAGSVAVIYRWNNQTQDWSYYLPGRQAIAGAGSAWFDTIDPGDTVFIYSTASRSVSIPWS